MQDDERRLRYLVAAFIAALAATMALLVFGADAIDLEAVVPWGPASSNDIESFVPGVDPMPSSSGEGQGLAIAILVTLNIVAGAPLAFRGKWRSRLSVFSFSLVSLFVLVSINRVGILYVPSAWMLGLASVGRILRSPL
jgi:hypothetical protein